MSKGQKPPGTKGELTVPACGPPEPRIPGPVAPGKHTPGMRPFGPGEGNHPLPAGRVFVCARALGHRRNCRMHSVNPSLFPCSFPEASQDLWTKSSIWNGFFCPNGIH